MYNNRYGVIFWNEETDNEILVYCDAHDWFAANDMFDKYNVVEYEKGAVHWLHKDQYHEYPIALKDLHKHCILHIT